MRHAGIVLLLSGLGAFAGALTLPLIPAGHAPTLAFESVPGPDSVDYSTDSLSAVVIQRNLFRQQRRPTPDRYTPYANDPVAVPPTPSFALKLMGIIEAEVQNALIEGIPGTEAARLVRAGDTVAGAVVTNVGRDGITLRNGDSVWVLPLRAPW